MVPTRDEVVARHVEFVAGRCRPNTVIATGSDLRIFFATIDKHPVEVTAADVFAFIAAQRRGPDGGQVVRLSDGEAGLAARTIKRRLASVSGLFNYLVLCGERSSNPVPRGMANRRTGAGGRATSSPLIRTPRTLPRVLDPADVIALLGGGSPVAGPGDARSDGPRRSAVLRGDRSAPGGPPADATATVHRGGQGRSSTGGAAVVTVLRQRLELPVQRTSDRRRERPVVRVVEGRPSGRRVVDRRARADRACRQGREPGWVRRRVTSCATPA